MEKFFGENALMEQTFVKDSDKTIKDVLTSAISSFGENISIARFSRFELGETGANSESQKS